MKIQTYPVIDLIPDPDNARSHSKRNINLLAESLAQFGQRKPVVITSDNIVLAGNGTLQAAKLLGWEEIQVIIVPDQWTEEQRRAFAIADNRSAELAKWNQPLLAAQLEALTDLGFTPGSLGFELPGSPEPQQNSTKEIDVDSFDFDHQCPECGFEFDAR
jgi:ParB-like chromosome segregation protein Spo0J